MVNVSTSSLSVITFGFFCQPCGLAKTIQALLSRVRCKCNSTSLLRLARLAVSHPFWFWAASPIRLSNCPLSGSALAALSPNVVHRNYPAGTTHPIIVQKCTYTKACRSVGEGSVLQCGLAIFAPQHVLYQLVCGARGLDCLISKKTNLLNYFGTS